ncbi:MAG TPA: sigma factor, partial [Polyangiaceae bacterium]
MAERDRDESHRTGIVSVATAISFAAVPQKMSEESELIARAAKGDTAAFRALYQRHRSDVARLVYRMLNGSADVEDVVQEVFVQVY